MKIDLKALRALCDAATHGPWRVTNYKSSVGENTIQTEDNDVIAWACCEIPKFLDSLEAHAWRSAKTPTLEANARFIAATDPQTVRALIDEIERKDECLKLFHDLLTATNNDLKRIRGDGQNVLPIDAINLKYKQALGENHDR